MAKISNEDKLREAADFYNEFNYISTRSGINPSLLRYVCIGLLNDDGQYAMIGMNNTLAMIRYEESQLIEKQK